jgi:hypothetical protein
MRDLNGLRKDQGHHGTPAVCIANVHAASAGIHDAACNGEAQSGAAALLVGAPEPREYQLTQLGWNPWAVIANLYFRLRADNDIDLSGGRCMNECVLDEITQGALQ